MAYLDPQQIEQAVNNYMMNATRYTKPGRSVRLSLSSTKDSFYLSVYNDGPRLPEAELTKGLDRFSIKRKTEEWLPRRSLFRALHCQRYHEPSPGFLRRAEPGSRS